MDVIPNLQFVMRKYLGMLSAIIQKQQIKAVVLRLPSTKPNISKRDDERWSGNGAKDTKA